MRALFAVFVLSMTMVVGAQSPATDVFLMPGSDIVRPGNLPRVNLNIGVGHSFGTNEITAAYTYENAGSHGFWHTTHGSHTYSVGIMKSMNFGKTWALYGWQQEGVTSLTGASKGVQNRLYTGTALGVICHFNARHGIWLQESYSKIATIPWYTTTNVGYVFSF